MRVTPFLIGSTALLAGCTVGPDYKGPPAVASDAATRGSFVRAADGSYSAAPGLARWWETFGDATLTSLVDTALAHSPDIALAEGRIREAQAQLRQQRTADLPSISASGTYLHGELPGGTLGASGGGTSIDFYNLGANASWEPDLFGGVRRGKEEARANVERRFADLADAQVSLSAQVAQAYINLRDVQERMRLNARSSELQRQALALSEQRFRAGTASALEVDRLRGQLQNTDAEAIPLGAQRDQYLNQLAVLTGQAPGALDGQLSSASPVPLPPAQVAIGDPATLIAHRPDIRSAESALAASNAEIGVQKAKLFPSLRFMGILGLGGTKPGDVLDPGNLTTLLAPMLQWNFLDFGRQRAATREAEAKRDQAEAQYRKAVLGALEDAETSLSRFGNVRLQLAQLVQAEATASRTAALNNQRVQAGTSSLIDQLDIERQRVGASIAVAQAKAQLAISYVGVQKSLGLGWRDEAAQPQAPAAATP